MAPKKPHKERTKHTTTNSRQLLHFVYFSPSPWGAPVLLLFGGGTFLTLSSVYVASLPILSFLSGAGVLPPWRPESQSGGVKSWGWGGASRPGSRPPRAGSSSVLFPLLWGPSSGLIWGKESSW